MASADVMIAMDQSQSMVIEQWWIKFFVNDLEKTLKAKGLGTLASCPNRYAMWTFGRAAPCSQPIANGLFLREQDFAGNFSGRLSGDSGVCKDGYQAMHAALTSDRRSKANRCVRPILVLLTDEDRDRCGCGYITKKYIIRSYLKPLVIEYAAVIDIELMADDPESRALGVSRDNAFVPVPGTYHDFRATRFLKPGTAYGNTFKDYYRMALKKEVDGTVWSSQMLRNNNIWKLAHALRSQLVRRIPSESSLLYSSVFPRRNLISLCVSLCLCLALSLSSAFSLALSPSLSLSAFSVSLSLSSSLSRFSLSLRHNHVHFLHWSFPPCLTPSLCLPLSSASTTVPFHYA